MVLCSSTSKKSADMPLWPWGGGAWRLAVPSGYPMAASSVPEYVRKERIGRVVDLFPAVAMST